MPSLTVRFGFSLALFMGLHAPAHLDAQTFGGLGSRAQGMGSAFVAVADDATAVVWNPAGLATGAFADIRLEIGGGRGADGRTPTRLTFLGGAVPALGLSYYRLALPAQAAGISTVSGSGDREEGGSGEVRAPVLTTTNFGITVLQTIVSGLVVGSTVRVVNGRVAQADDRTTVDLDVGVMASVSNVRIGLAARNLRKRDFAADSGSVRLERHVRAGAAWVPRSLQAGVHGPYSLALDVDLTEGSQMAGDSRRAAAGGEFWWIGGRVGTRAGLSWRTSGTAELAYSGGLTVKFPRSVFGEGHLTKVKDSGDTKWSLALHVTF
jgi:hypothetical protein